MERYGNTKALFYLAHINEYYKFDIKSMLEQYIDFLNEYNNHDKSSTIESKLSSYYYLFNQKMKSLHLKSLLLKCNRMIKDTVEYDLIVDCYEDEELLFYSDDSLKSQITSKFNYLKNSSSAYNKFKNNLSFISNQNEIIYQDFAYFTNLLYSVPSLVVDAETDDSLLVNYPIEILLTTLEDSTLNLMNSYLELDETQIQADINEISDYLLIFNNLSMQGNNENPSNEKEQEQKMNFQNLNLEGIDLENLNLFEN